MVIVVVAFPSLSVFLLFASHFFLCFWELCVHGLLSFSHARLFWLTGESKYEENWIQLAKMLNNTLGPKKSIEEWKMVKHNYFLQKIIQMPSWIMNKSFPHSQVFFNWKNQLRTRAKKLKQIQDGRTSADDKLALQKLTDVEKRALKLWREDCVDKDIASVSFFIFLIKHNFCFHIAYRYIFLPST